MGRERPRRRETFLPNRSSGVLLHPTSLPEGRLGPDAYRFVDWLVQAGQSFWQILPLGPPDSYGSPYAGTSAFAGWAGLLAEPEAHVSKRELGALRHRHAYWLDDWVEFTGDPEEAAVQVRFEREWGALRRYANERRVRVIGDLPLYVARESADTAAHSSLFDFTRVAGVPPDLFSRTGQLWGSPPYRWDVSRRDGHRWWIERFRRSLQLFDAIRLDHFRGFVAYWAVRHGRRTARKGRWLRGPGRSLFETVRAELGALPVIAEDLGHITPAVHRLRDELGVPGMHVLQWSFGEGPRSRDALPKHREHAVVYTGTHDNDTASGWWAWAPDEVRARVDEERSRARIEAVEPAWVMIELTLSSRARVAVLQAQDVLGLGSEARMNTPATVGGNWQWRLEPGQLTAAHAARLRETTRRWRRVGR